MNFTLDSTTYEFELRNMNHLQDPEQEEMLMKKAITILFNKRAQSEVQDVPYKNHGVGIKRQVSNNGSTFYISPNPRTSGKTGHVAHKKKRPSEGVFYKESAMIKNKDSQFGKFMFKEYLKDKQNGQLPLDYGQLDFKNTRRAPSFKQMPSMHSMKGVKGLHEGKRDKFKITGELKFSSESIKTFGKYS